MDNILNVSTKKDKYLAKLELSLSYEIKNIRQVKLIFGICINQNKVIGNIILS